jgi:hypothetical protein
VAGKNERRRKEYAYASIPAVALRLVGDDILSVLAFRSAIMSFAVFDALCGGEIREIRASGSMKADG